MLVGGRTQPILLRIIKLPCLTHCLTCRFCQLQYKSCDNTHFLPPFNLVYTLMFSELRVSVIIKAALLTYKYNNQNLQSQNTLRLARNIMSL